MTPVFPRAAVAALLLASVTVASLVAGCQALQSAGRAPARAAASVESAARLVWDGTYTQNIQPIFEQRCVNCHGHLRAENGLSLAAYEDVMKGTQFGRIVIPGQPAFSTLISVSQGKVDSTIQVAHSDDPLSPQERQNLQLWVQAGAPPD